MYARKDFKRQFFPNLNARPVLAAVRRRFAAWVDVRVARWLERCASRVETAQGLFPDRSPCREFGMGRESSHLIATLG
jgi:hypothetical protein